jgi:hypothetical protein
MAAKNQGKMNVGYEVIKKPKTSKSQEAKK